MSFRLYIFLLASISLILCHFICKNIFTEEKTLRSVFLVGLAFIFLVLPAYDFGQREHLMLILITPYLLMLASNLQGKIISSTWTAIIALLAAIGFAIKPYFLITFVLIELYYLSYTKKILRLENSVILGFILLYLISIFIIHPDYINVIVPYALRWCYQSASVPWHFLMVFPPVFFCLIPILFYLLKTRRGPYQTLNAILMIALISFLFSYFAQQTLFPYHIYPALAYTILTLLLFLSVWLRQENLIKRDYVLIPLISIILIIFLYYKTETPWTILIFQPELFYTFFIFIFSLLFFLQKSYLSLSKIILYVTFIISYGVLFSNLIEVSPWYQHRFLLTILFFILCFSIIVPTTPKNRINQTLFCLLAILLFSFPLYISNAFYLLALTYKEHAKKMITLIEKNSPHRSVYFLATAMDQISILQTANIEPRGRFSALWMLGGMVKKTYYSQPDAGQLLSHDKNLMITMVAQDLEENKPDLVFIDVKQRKNNLLLFYKDIASSKPIPFDYLNYFLPNPHFQKAWLAYHYLTTLEAKSFGAEIYKFEVYKRSELFANLTGNINKAPTI